MLQPKQKEASELKEVYSRFENHKGPMPLDLLLLGLLQGRKRNEIHFLCENNILCDGNGKEGKQPTQQEITKKLYSAVNEIFQTRTI